MKVYIITEDQLNASITALRYVAHNEAGHSQGEGTFAKEETAEWHTADELERIKASVVPTPRVYTELADVRAFHEKFAVPMATEPSFLDVEAADFRQRFMQEELDEFKEAVDQGDMLLAGDALVDLVYVVLGTALMMGLPWSAMWNEVQRANMAKERASSAGQSKRGSALDVVKPAGWTPPDHSQFIGQGPWPTFRASSSKGVRVRITGSSDKGGITIEREGSSVFDVLLSCAEELNGGVKSLSITAQEA